MIVKAFRAPAFHAAMVGLCNAAVQMASAFGVGLTSDQEVAIAAMMNAGLLVVSLGLAAIGNAAEAKP